MTTCRMAGRLQPYLDGGLTPEATVATEVHLAACPACRERLRELQQLDGALRAEPLLVPPAGLAGEIARRAVARRGTACLVPRRLEAVTMGGLLVGALVAGFIPCLARTCELPAAVAPYTGAVAVSICGALALLGSRYFGRVTEG